MVPSITKELLIKRVALPLIAMAILVGAIAGCGGEGSSGATGSDPGTYVVEAGTTVYATSMTKARYVKYINGVCREAWGRILEFFDDYMASHPEMSERRRFAEAVRIPVLSSITFLIFDDMHMLGSPRGEEREIEEIIGPLQASVELGQKRRPPLYSVAEITEHFTEYNRRARRYGLDDCLVNESHLRLNRRL